MNLDISFPRKDNVHKFNVISMMPTLNKFDELPLIIILIVAKTKIVNIKYNSLQKNKIKCHFQLVMSQVFHGF